MAEAILNQPRFQTEEAAREHLEALRWPNGPVCPHCGGTERNSALNGESHRAGLYFCGDCRQQFTVTVGTVFERSKIPLHQWVLATHLLCSSKKGMSSHQLHRTLGVTYKTAWFMAHRIRKAMEVQHTDPMGGSGKTVEADETYWGKKDGVKTNRGTGHKHAIFSLVERNGAVRSFHVPRVNGKTLKPILRLHVQKDATVFTDEHGAYKDLDKDFAKHETVAHSRGEYARGTVHTNTIEGYFSLLKRGLIGTYHHVSEAHLKRYMSEFDFRYSNRDITDTARAESALKGISGKRLTYRRTHA